MNLATIRELFGYNDWMRDRLMALIEPLDDSRLDRPFEMGPGSIRKTMEHLAMAEWLWLKRWKGWCPKEQDLPKTGTEMVALWKFFRDIARERESYLDTLKDEELDRDVTYTNLAGETYTFRLGHLFIHVCNHGTHHRAQVVNMLRHVGVTTPPTDYLVMHKERQPNNARTTA